LGDLRGSQRLEPVQCRRWLWSQVSIGASASGRTLTNRHCLSIRRSISPALSSTFKCREIAGVLIAKGAATSPTVSSPATSNRSIMARRVESESAAKRSSSCGLPSGAIGGHLISYLINRLINRLVF